MRLFLSLCFFFWGMPLAEPLWAQTTDVRTEKHPPEETPGDTPVTLTILGDSIGAGFGLPPHEGLPAQLERALKTQNVHVRVFSSSVSGDTTAGGLRRLDWALLEEPDYVLIELGGNDGLRGLDLAGSQANLSQIIVQLKAKGVQPILAGMRAPPNLGPDYATAFYAIYEDLAATHQIPLFPFLLEDVAGVRELNQADGIHPNTRGVQKIAHNLALFLKEVLAPPPPS